MGLPTLARSRAALLPRTRAVGAKRRFRVDPGDGLACQLFDCRHGLAVMGGDDWRRWMQMLLEEKLLAEGARTLAYSYIGPEITWPIYRDGTIGQVLSEVVEALSGGSLVGILLLTAVFSAILGMGLPTTPNYIVVASLLGMTLDMRTWRRSTSHLNIAADSSSQRPLP